MTLQLTPELLKKLLKAEPEILRIASDRVQAADPGVELGEPVRTLDEAARTLETIPEIQRFLTSINWTAREFLLTLRSTVQTVLLIELIDSGQRAEPLSDIVRANMQLWKNPPAELVVPLADWKQAQMDPIVKTLRDTGNQ